MSKTLTDIACHVRMIREKAIAVADGTSYMHDDGVHGEIEREKWFWLPLSQIEVDPSDYDVGDAVTVTLPEWLAMERGLV